MEFKRTPRQHFFTVLTFVLVGWLCYDFLIGERTWEKVLGVLCGLWAVLILVTYMRTQSFGRLEPDGLTLHRPLRRVSFTWDQLQWANMGDDNYALVFAYRHQGDVKDRYIGCGRKVLGPDAVNAIREAVYAARPNLPSGPPEAHKNGATT